MSRWLENAMCDGLDKLYLLAPICGAMSFNNFVPMSQTLTLNRERVFVALDEKHSQGLRTYRENHKRNVARQSLCIVALRR